MENPLVSIIIPAYNCADYLAKTVESVQNQQYLFWELVIVDDGSTDKTLEVIEKLIESDSRIRLLKQPNGRQGKARNNGIRHAKGEWIAFLDADDLWPENKLSLQLSKTLEANVDLSFTDGFICLGNNMNLREFRFGVIDKFHQGYKSILEFHEQNRIPTSSVLVKKSALLEVGGFSEKLKIQNCEDYLLWVTLLTRGKKYLGIEEPLLFYRVHDGSSTSTEYKAKLPLIYALLEMPGGYSFECKNHLKITFKKLVFRLNELGEINKANSFIIPVLDVIYSGLIKQILILSWKISPHIFIRIFWRLENRKKSEVNSNQQ
jgi:teichuronic acid biosynthesis glycosyltransferase TuaG